MEFVSEARRLHKQALEGGMHEPYPDPRPLPRRLDPSVATVALSCPVNLFQDIF